MIMALLVLIYATGFITPEIPIIIYLVLIFLLLIGVSKDEEITPTFPYPVGSLFVLAFLFVDEKKLFWPGIIYGIYVLALFVSFIIDKIKGASFLALFAKYFAIELKAAFAAPCFIILGFGLPLLPFILLGSGGYKKNTGKDLFLISFFLR